MKRDFLYEYKTEPYHIGRSFSLYPIPHLHKNIELVYVVSGDCTAYIEHNAVCLKRGDLFIAFPNQIHYYSSSPESEFIVIIFDTDVLFGLDDILFGNHPKYNVITIDDNDILKNQILSTMNEYGKYEKTFVAGIINQIFASVLSRIELQPRVQTENALFQSIISFCEENYTNSNLSLAEISNNLHINKYHISRLFNKVLKINFNSYITMLRVNKACHLLDKTDKKIVTISEEVGFGSLRTMNRSFFEITGTTPKKYRSERKV